MTAPKKDWILYGAYGYTGSLIVQRAVEEGLKPTVAGRDERKLRSLAQKFDLPFLAFPLTDSRALGEALKDHTLIVLTAGPFTVTAPPVLEGCLECGCDYLDITGEIQVFEHLYTLDGRAREKKVTLVSGVGLDIVPTDCLAVELAERLPGAERLEILLYGVSQPSGGTVASLLGVLKERGFLVLQDGRLIRLPWGNGGKWFDLPHRRLWGIPAPLADLVAGPRSTGIQTIHTYTALPPSLNRLLRLSQPFLRFGLSVPGILPLLQGGARALVKPPSPEDRQRGETWVWGRVEKGGQAVEGVLHTVEGYTFTAFAVVEAVKRFLSSPDSIPYGALTPAQALGKGFVYAIPGTERVK